jgi:hypothetical protein
MKEMEVRQTTWCKEILSAKWIAFGDKCSKPFFKTFEGMSSSIQLHQMLDKYNQLCITWDSVAKAAVSHFQNILGTFIAINQTLPGTGAGGTGMRGV